MTVTRRIGLAAVAALALGLMAASPFRSGRIVEVRRVQAHADSVIVELRQRDVHGFPPEVIARRMALIKELGRYRDAGEFPHNYDFPGRMVPYFVDRKTGALCAVADLLSFSGRRDIVERVSRTNNNAYVQDLAGDTSYTNWLQHNGLTMDETARIQVPYTTSGGVSGSPERIVTVGVVSVVALGGSVITGALNAWSNSDGHRTHVSNAGLGLGLVSAGMGAYFSSNRNTPSSYTRSALALGVTSMALSLRSRLNHSSSVSTSDSLTHVATRMIAEPGINAKGRAEARMGFSLGF